VVFSDHEEIISELKTQWKTLWKDRIDDGIRAEGIAKEDYSMLFIEKGTVIFATRDFKAENLKEILELHGIHKIDRIIPPNPHAGGWSKFIRTAIKNQRITGQRTQAYQRTKDKKQNQQLKRGGKGWLHF